MPQLWLYSLVLYCQDRCVDINLSRQICLLLLFGKLRKFSRVTLRSPTWFWKPGTETMLSESSGHHSTLLDRQEVAFNGNPMTSWAPILALPKVLRRC